MNDDRKDFIGGSDIAAVLGISPWRPRTPLELYREKRGEAEPEEIDEQRERNFRRGKRAEPHAIDMLIEDYGVKVTKRSVAGSKNYYIDPKHTFLRAEIDFEWEVPQEFVDVYGLDQALVGTTQNGEVKSVHPFAFARKFGEEATDEIPMEYAAQAQHGLGLSGRLLTLFVVLSGWDDLTIYFIPRDDPTIAGIRARAISLWLEHIVPGVPPPPIILADVLDLFERKSDVVVKATEEMIALYQQFSAAKLKEKAAGEAIEDLKFKLALAMLGAERASVKPAPMAKHVMAVGDAALLTIDFRTQNRVDGDKLKKEFPDVAQKCLKQSSFYQFNLPRGKKK